MAFKKLLYNSMTHKVNILSSGYKTFFLFFAPKYFLIDLFKMEYWYFF